MTIFQRFGISLIWICGTIFDQGRTGDHGVSTRAIGSKPHACGHSNANALLQFLCALGIFGFLETVNGMPDAGVRSDRNQGSRTKSPPFRNAPNSQRS